MNFLYKVYLFAIIAVFAQPVRCAPTRIVPTINAIISHLFDFVAHYKKVPDKKTLSSWLDKKIDLTDFDATEKRIIVHVSRKILTEMCFHFASGKSELQSVLKKTEQFVRDYKDHLSRASSGGAEIPQEFAVLADFGLMDGDFLFGDPGEIDTYQEDFVPVVEQNRKPKKCNQQKRVQNLQRRVSGNKRSRRNKRSRWKKRFRAQVKANQLSKDSYGAPAKEGFLSLLKTIFCRFV